MWSPLHPIRLRVRLLAVQKQIDRFTLALLFLYVTGVFALAMQPLRTIVASGYEGVYFKGGDESQYIMRVQDAMTHPWTDVSNAVTTGPDAPRGLQMTLFETLAGSLFAWTGFSATAITVLLSVLLSPLVTVFIGLLAVRLGSSRRVALLFAFLYFFLLFGPLRRVIHQSWSLPYMLGTLLLMLSWWREPSRGRTISLGILLGLVPGIYFWAWTYLWAVFGILVVLGVVERFAHREPRVVQSMLFHAFGAGIIALLTALPFFTLLWLNAHHPAAAEAGIRSSLIAARELESARRSLVLLILTASTVLWVLRSTEWKRAIPALALVLALFVVLHQQFIHGLVLSYWTHYYPYVCAVSVLLLAVIVSQSRRGILEYCTAMAACVFLIGAFNDYKGRGSFNAPLPQYTQYQHLSGMLASLTADPAHETVLTDRETSLIIGNATQHDVVFTPFLRHVLISDRELAERYCLTEILKGIPPDTEWLAYDIRELSAAGRAGTQAVLEKDLALTKDACVWVSAHEKEALKKYGVTRLAWDERNHPEWRINQKLFTSVVKGPGWSLWSVR